MSRRPAPPAFAALFTVMVAACAPAGGADTAADDETADGAAAATPGQEASGALSAEERAEGFEVLFGGETLDGWRGFNRSDVPGGWAIEGDALVFTPGVEGGDIITADTFTDFDLRLEWKVGPAGNSGVFFGVVEGNDRTYESGPEMQILDNEGHRDGGSPLTSAGANYGLHGPSADVTRPVGEWNEARIVRRGARVEHWLNGTRVVEYELGTDEWNALVADTKFAEWPDYGVHHEGHIGLQDHGDRVEFRNIRILRLDP